MAAGDSASRAGAGIDDAAAGDDHRRRRRADQSHHLGQLGPVGLWPADPPDAGAKNSSGQSCASACTSWQRPDRPARNSPDRSSPAARGNAVKDARAAGCGRKKRTTGRKQSLALTVPSSKSSTCCKTGSGGDWRTHRLRRSKRQTVHMRQRRRRHQVGRRPARSRPSPPARCRRIAPWHRRWRHGPWSAVLAAPCRQGRRSRAAPRRSRHIAMAEDRPDPLDEALALLGHLHRQPAHHRLRRGQPDRPAFSSPLPNPSFMSKYPGIRPQPDGAAPPA